ncbi:histone H1.10 [Hemiscyllium ocellatum]|uniref:histone H1.10 n=1 Tax=Hemiscyllium ocellatum TaxID=170820 RepID=UPI0029675C01|nr:histone H1.10 [Hemiscyllium ocellatum]
MSRGIGQELENGVQIESWAHPLARSRAPPARGTVQKPLERQHKKHKLRQLLDRAVDVPIDVRSVRINKRLRRAISAAAAAAERTEQHCNRLPRLYLTPSPCNPNPTVCIRYSPLQLRSGLRCCWIFGVSTHPPALCNLGCAMSADVETLPVAPAEEEGPKSPAKKAGSKKKKSGKGKNQQGRYSALLVEIVQRLGARNGSSLATIYKEAKTVPWFNEHQGRTYLRYALRALVLNGTLNQVKGRGANGSFKVTKKADVGQGAKKKKASNSASASSSSSGVKKSHKKGASKNASSSKKSRPSSSSKDRSKSKKGKATKKSKSKKA